MKIGFYLSQIKPADGGIFQYSIYLLKMLLHCDNVEKIYLFYSNDQTEYFVAFLKHEKIKPVLHNETGRITTFLRHFADFWLTRYYIKSKPNPITLQLYRIINPDRRFLNKYQIDILHVPRQHSPAYGLKYPVVVSMHDIQHFHFPEFFTPLERIYKSVRYYTTIREADHIIVSFNHVKNDLKKYFKHCQTNISVCAVPLNEEWLSHEGTPAEDLKKKYKLPPVFILTPAATWEHKNHLAVLEAINILKKGGFDIFWVSTGHKTSFYKEIKQKIENLNLQEQVLFTGVVSDSDLRGLYNIASLVVIPTLYEAGSGPLFEAMRYNVPVICSNVTSLPETIGNTDFVFNPLNSLEIADSIKKALTDQNFIKSNLENSRTRTEYYRNMDYANCFTRAYQEAINNFKTIKKKKND